jgi:transcriptional regulator with XRE-family HTH domain
MSESPSLNQARSRLLREFWDKNYRHGYADDFLNAFIAAQIRAIRDQRGWTQAQLAEHSGMRQSRISAMEDVNYASWSIRTLARLAEAFDVALAVCFKPFSKRIDDINSFSPDGLRVSPYLDDLCRAYDLALPPRVTDASAIAPDLANIIQAFAEFKSDPTVAIPTKIQEYTAALLRALAGARTTPEEHRAFREWLLGLSASARDAARSEVEAQKQRTIAEISGAAQRAVDSITEATRRDVERIAKLRQDVLNVIAQERERIRQDADAATARGDISATRVLRDVEENWLGVERRVGELVYA